MFSEKKFRAYQELQEEFFEESETILTEIAGVEGFSLTDSDGEPFCSFSSVDAYWSGGKEEMIIATARYKYGKYELSDIFEGKHDLKIEVSFPAIYLWAENRAELFDKDLAIGRVSSLSTGKWDALISKVPAPRMEGVIVSFDNQAHSGIVRSASGATFFVPPHLTPPIDKMSLTQDSKVLICPLPGLESPVGDPIARIYGIILEA